MKRFSRRSWGQRLIAVSLLGLLPAIFFPEFNIGSPFFGDQLYHQGSMIALKCTVLLLFGLLGGYLIFSCEKFEASSSDRRMVLVTIGFVSLLVFANTGFPFSENMSVWRRSSQAFSSYCQENGLEESDYYRTLKSNKLGYSYSEYAPGEVGAKAEFTVKTYWFESVSVQKIDTGPNIAPNEKLDR